MQVSARYHNHTAHSCKSAGMKLIGTLLLLSIVDACFATAAPTNGYRSRATNSQFINSDCNEEFLVSIANDSKGVALSVLATHGNNDQRVLHFAGQKLPSDTQCGEDNFRCKSPLIIKNIFLNSTIMFVPLHNALLLANFVLNDTGLNLEECHLINLTRFNCTPVTSFKILNSVYTICLNIEESYLGLFEIRLNSDSLTRASIIGPLAQNYFSIQSSSQVSDFKYIELYNFHFIYFAFANYLYYFDPLNYVLNYAGHFHPNCTSVKELVYIGGDTLTGYCREGATIYFDLNYESWTFYQPYINYGRPFVCPDPSKILVVFLQGGYVRFNVNETKTIRLELVGENFISGECFGDSSGFYFVYVDQQEGTFILDFTTFNFTQLSTQQPCFNNNLKCMPVQVLDNQYLIVQQWENHENFTDSNNNTVLWTAVFDAQDNFQIITTFSEMNRSTSLISIIANNLKPCTSTISVVDTTVTSMATNTEVTTTIQTEISETMEGHVSTTFPAPSFSIEVTVAIGIGVAGLALIVLLIVVTTLILIVVVRYYTENKSTSG